MNENITLDEYRRAAREVGVEVVAESFRVHVIIVVVNVVLAILNFLLLPEFIFFYYATIGWGVGLLVQYFMGYRRRQEIVEKRLDRVEKLARG
ncbi:MAG: 2TM domain-containing protein [Rubrobacter sp.]